MHKLKITLFALLATLALAATTAATATAIPDMPELLQVKEKSAIETKSGEARLQTLAGTAILCAKSKGKGEIVTRLEGTLALDFEGCKETSLKTECLSAGEAKETILADKIDWRLVYDTEPETGTKLGAGIIFKLLETIHITCPKAGVLVLVFTGFEVLGLLKPTNELVKVLTLQLEQAGGDNLENTYWELVEGKFVSKKPAASVSCEVSAIKKPESVPRQSQLAKSSVPEAN